MNKTSLARHLAKTMLPCLTVVVCALLPAPLARAEEVFQFKWKESGIREVQGRPSLSLRPQGLVLAASKPEDVKQVPADLANPFYGTIEMGPPKSKVNVHLLLDLTNGIPTRFLLDGNGNGDFTDDPPCVSTNYPSTEPRARAAAGWTGEGMVTFPSGAGPRTGKLIFYGLRSIPSEAGVARGILYYYADYGLTGEVKIDGQTIPAVLQDAGAAGCFKVVPDVMGNPLLSLLANDPATSRRSSHQVQRPFQWNGKWWAVTNLTLDGAFQIAASSAPPEETKKKPEVDLSPGKKGQAFTAKLLGGKTVKFPDDYKGKIVLVDFWATWCAPCVAELPNIVKAYEQYHDRGFEVLGISLDREDWDQKLAEFTKKRNMPWPQVYQSTGDAEVASLYGVHSIPRMLLMDGDTGVILADTRGAMLAPAIEKALSGKTK